jgi:hypothetical protein
VQEKSLGGGDLGVIYGCVRRGHDAHAIVLRRVAPVDTGPYAADPEEIKEGRIEDWFRESMYVGAETCRDVWH